MKIGRLAILIFGALPAVAACSSEVVGVDPDSSAIIFTQNVDPGATMDALFEGRVVLDQTGCLRLASTAGATVIWPAGYALRAVGNALEVMGPDGEVKGRVGGVFRIGGGEVPILTDRMPISDEVRSLARDLCPGRFWLAGDVL